MKKSLLFLFFVGFSVGLFGNSDSLKVSFRIDSLQELIKTSKIDSNTINHYHALSLLQREKRDFKTAIKSAINAEELAIKARDIRRLGVIYDNLTILYRISGDLEAQLKLYKKLIHHYRAVDDSGARQIAHLLVEK